MNKIKLQHRQKHGSNQVVQTLVSHCAYCFSMRSNFDYFILEYHESALTASKVAGGLFKYLVRLW